MSDTTIAHLSDLHFVDDRAEHLAAWGVLRRFLSQLKPDIVVVTGDLADMPRQLHIACEQLVLLAQELGLPILGAPELAKHAAASNRAIDDGEDERGLLVVPGNHDIRWRGNAWQNRGPWDRHIGVPEERGVWFPHRNIVFYTFDSCYAHGPYKLLPFARGRIGEREIADFVKWCGGRGDRHERMRFAGALKIALVHHHPLPIASTEQGSELQLRPFVAMDNGGHLVRVLAEHGFTILLHGHDHCPQLSRIEVHHLDRSDPAVWVVAGGSASCPIKPPAVGHAINVLRVDISGNVAVGVYVKLPDVFERRRSYLISPWDARRKEISSLFASTTDFEFGRIVKRVEIDATGCARVSVRFENGILSSTVTAADTIRLRLPRAVPGGLPVSWLGVDAHVEYRGGARRSIAWKPLQRDESDVKGTNDLPFIQGCLHLGGIQRTDGPFDLDVKYVVPNAMVTNAEQHKVLYGHAKHGADQLIERTEYVSLPLDNPAHELAFEVVFQPSAPGAYPAIHELAKLTGFDLEPRVLVGQELSPSEHWKDQSWLMRREGQRQLHLPSDQLKAADETRANDGALVLRHTVADPIPGLRYFLGWKLPSVNHERVKPDTPEASLAVGLAERARDRLLARRDELGLPLRQQFVGAFLAQVRDELARTRLAKVPNEFIEVGISVFDKEELRLVFCAGEFQGGATPATEQYIPGEGVIGHAFKMKRTVLWRPRKGFEGSLFHSECIYRRPRAYDSNHEAVLAIPLLSPLETGPESGGGSSPTGVTPQLGATQAWRYVIGILVLRSLDPGSVLLGLRSDDDPGTPGNVLTKFVTSVWREFDGNIKPILIADR